MRLVPQSSGISSIKMKRIATIFLVLFALDVSATEGLAYSDYPGIWLPIYTADKNAPEKLIINPDFSGIFEIRRKDKESETFQSSKQSLVKLDDLLVFFFKDKEERLRYKVVLSGWSSYESEINHVNAKVTAELSPVTSAAFNDI